MVKIEYYDEPRETFLEYDTMMSVASGRNQLMKGDTVNTGIRSAITLFAQGIIFFLMEKAYHFILPEGDPVFGKIFIGLGFALIGLNLLALAMSFYGYRQNIKLGQLKADLMFDERGIHAWETDIRGLDIDWRYVTHCFISRKQIYILFTHRRLIITIPYSKEHRDKIVQAMMIGKKLEVIKFLDIKKGVVSIRNK